MFVTLLTCIDRLLAIVKLGIGGKPVYVLVRAVSDRPSIDPVVKDTGKDKKNHMLYTFYQVVYSKISSFSYCRFRL